MAVGSPRKMSDEATNPGHPSAIEEYYRFTAHQQVEQQQAGAAMNGAGSADGLGDVLNRSEDLQNRLRALLQATDTFFAKEEIAGVQTPTALGQQQHFWTPAAEDGLGWDSEAEAPSQQVIAAPVKITPQRASRYNRREFPVLEAVREGLHEDGTPSPITRSPASPLHAPPPMLSPGSSASQKDVQDSTKSVSLDKQISDMNGPLSAVNTNLVMESHLDDAKISKISAVRAPESMTEEFWREFLQSSSSSSGCTNALQNPSAVILVNNITASTSITSPRHAISEAFQPQTSVEHVENENSENPAKIPCPSVGLSWHKQVLQASRQNLPVLFTESVAFNSHEGEREGADEENPHLREIIFDWFVGIGDILEDCSKNVSNKIRQFQTRLLVADARMQRASLWVVRSKEAGQYSLLSPRKDNSLNTTAMIVSLKSDCARLDAECTKLKETNAQLTRKLSASLKYKVDLERALYDKHDLENQINDLKSTNAQQHLQELQIRVDKLTSDLGRSSAYANSLRQDLDSSQAQVQTLSLDLDSSQGTIQKLIALTKDAEARIKEAEEFVNDFQGSMQGLQSENEFFKKKITELDAVVAGLRNQVTEYQQANCDLESLRRNEEELMRDLESLRSNQEELLVLHEKELQAERERAEVAQQERLKEMEVEYAARAASLQQDKESLLQVREEFAGKDTAIATTSEITRLRQESTEKDRQMAYAKNEAAELRDQMAKLQDDYLAANQQHLSESASISALKRQICEFEIKLLEKEKELYEANSNMEMSREEVLALKELLRSVEVNEHHTMQGMQGSKIEGKKCRQSIGTAIGLEHSRRESVEGEGEYGGQDEDMFNLRQENDELRLSLEKAHKDIDTYRLHSLQLEDSARRQRQNAGSATPGGSRSGGVASEISRSPPPIRISNVTATTGNEEAARNGVDHLWCNLNINFSPFSANEGLKGAEQAAYNSKTLGVISPLSLAAGHMFSPRNAGEQRDVFSPRVSSSTVPSHQFISPILHPLGGGGLEI